MIIRLAMRKALEAPGGRLRLSWTNTPAIFANFFAHQAGPNSQKSQTTVLSGGMYGTDYKLGAAEVRKQVQHCGYVFAGASHLSSEAGSQTVDPNSFPKRLAVQVGALLKIDLLGTKAAINAVVGENLEEISIQPVWTESNCESAECEALSISHSQDRVSLGKSEPLDRSTIQLSKLLELNVHVPARWCSLDVQAGEGPVHVENVREGNVRVTTAGGDIKLGEVKGGEAFIETHGGEFRAKVLQAGSFVSTDGGKLYVDKLQGDIIKLDSGGGGITVGTLYGSDVTLQSSGGSLEARHIQAQQIARVTPKRLVTTEAAALGFDSKRLNLVSRLMKSNINSEVDDLDLSATYAVDSSCKRGEVLRVLSSGGGTITVGGFDGNGVFVSGGGRIEVQLSEHAEEVSIDATDGEVILSLSSKLIAQLKHEGAQGVVEHENILEPSDVSNVYHFSGSESGSRKLGHDLGWRGSENHLRNANNDTVSCRIVVRSAGRLVVKQKGWLPLRRTL